MINGEEGMPAPTRLSAKGMAGKINHVEFSDSGDNTSFEIWRRHGDTVDWYLHATVDEPKFEDADVKPGQYYEYKVRAVRDGETSEFSESAVTYGAE